MNRILCSLSSVPKRIFVRVNYKHISCSVTNLAKMPEIEDTLRDHCRLLLPELRSDNHKGQCGRIGVFGGSLEFTGAPYYSGFSALRCGVDLVYVFCTAAAAPAIKSYSPELMVMPYLDSENAVDDISLWLDRLHAILIGPGLGRNEEVFLVLVQVIKLLNSGTHRAIPIVIDADGLFFLTRYPDIFKDYKNNVYLTPNIVEFSRLTKAILGTEASKPDELMLIELSQQVGYNVTVVLKGQVDVITQNNLIVKCSTEGSPRRCGGQGDLLSGILTAFAAWVDIKKPKFEISGVTPELVAGYSACHIVRFCNRLVYNEKGRGMLVTDMLEKVIGVCSDLFGEPVKKL